MFISKELVVSEGNVWNLNPRFELGKLEDLIVPKSAFWEVCVVSVSVDYVSVWKPVFLYKEVPDSFSWNLLVSSIRAFNLCVAFQMAMLSFLPPIFQVKKNTLLYELLDKHRGKVST